MKYRTDLPPCPICGSHVFVSRDIPGGFYMGWSVGCPRYRINDGIHGTDDNTTEKDHMVIYMLDSEEECVKKWIEKVERYKNESKT